MQLLRSSSISIIRQIVQKRNLHTVEILHLQACCRGARSHPSRPQVFIPFCKAGSNFQPGTMVLNSWQRCPLPASAAGHGTIGNRIRVTQLHLTSTRHVGAQNAPCPPASTLTAVTAGKSIQQQQTGSEVLPRSCVTGSQASSRRLASLTLPQAYPQRKRFGMCHFPARALITK